MPHIEKHPPGAFCWIELSTTDQNAAKSFYSSLFGWTSQDFPMGPTDFYTMFQLEGRDAAASRIPQLEGKLLAPPFDVYDIGRMAVVQDPTGAVFALWQPKKHTGTGISGVPGTLCCADLMTPDPARAKEFYTGLFGWRIIKGENDPSGYLHIANGENFIGGIPPAKFRDPNVPPHWLAYFIVSNCDESAAKAKELGAKIHLPPMTIENVGRWAILADPQGAVFAIFQAARHN